MVELEVVITLVALAGGVVATFFRSKIETTKEIEVSKAAIYSRIGKLQEDFSAMNVKVNLFWKTIEDNLPRLIKRPTHKRMDDLLDKFREKTITIEEMAELKPLLEELVKQDLADKNNQALGDMLMLGLINIRLYDELEKISGQSCGLHRSGGLMLADTKERMEWLKMAHARARYLNAVIVIGANGSYDLTEK